MYGICTYTIDINQMKVNVFNVPYHGSYGLFPPRIGLEFGPPKTWERLFSEEAFLLPFNVFGGSSKVFLPWTNIETMFSTSPWVLVFKLLFFKTLRKWCPQLDESFCWTQWRENPPTRSAKILPWFYNGISIWEHPNQVAKRMSWCRFLSEKLPNWSILVENIHKYGK